MLRIEAQQEKRAIMSFADIIKACTKTRIDNMKYREETANLFEVGGDVVSDPLKNALGTGFFRKAAPEADRSIGLHPSQLYGMCMRSKMFVENLDLFEGIPGVNTPFEESIPASLQAKFDIGHSLHHWYQNKYLGPMGILKGGWKCPQCKSVEEGFRPAIDCKNCGCDKWGFVEPFIQIPELGIVGHCDGIIDHGDGPWVLDIKTIDPDRFKNLSEVSMSYVYQVHCYMLALDIDRAVILYVDKSANYANPTKEFKIKKNNRIIRDIKKISEYYNESRTNRVLPEIMCKNKTCTSAKRCAFRSVCFDEDIVSVFSEKWGNTNV